MGKSKTVVCKMEPNGYLNSTIYVLGGGYVLNQIDTTTAMIADTIAQICESNEIETVALYGPETYLARTQQEILKSNTKFAYKNTKVLINPVEEIM